MSLIDLIPGDRISGVKFSKISSEILEAIKPEKVQIPEWFAQLELRTKQEILDLLRIDLQDRYYILYNHPVNNQENRLYLSQKDMLLQFIDSCFDEEHGDGIDVIISDESYKRLIIGNHDGMLMLA